MKNAYTEKDFIWTKMTSTQMKRYKDAYVERKKEVYARIKGIKKEERTFVNTVYALEKADGDFGTIFRQMGFLGEVSSKKEIRDTVHEVMTTLSQELVDIEYDKGLYTALLDYEAGAYKKEKKHLRKEDIKLFTEGLRDYKRMGFDLPLPKQKELKVLLKKCSKLSNEFSKNINDYHDAIVCTKEQLEGMSTRFIESLPKDASGNYIVTLQYPHVFPYLAEATNKEKRKELSLKLLQKGGKRNLKIINQIVELRAHIAKLLGYAHHADFKTENRMAKKGSTVAQFQDELLKKLIPKAKIESKELSSFARTLGIAKMEHSDISFVVNALKKKLYDVDPELIRGYFPLPHVMQELFTLCETIFGITIIKKDTKLWHKDAVLYEVTDEKGVVGYFAMDLFPREGKFSHAATFDVINAGEKEYNGKEENTPFAVVVCNFPDPQGKGKKQIPSLLSLGEVETLYHEFGHCLHMILTTAKIESHAGASVAWDFVETPSQIMENWVWDDEELQKLSRHYLTGEVMPEAMRKRVIEGKLWHSAYFYTRQIIQGKIDLELHMGKIKDPTKAYRDMYKKYFSIELPVKETLFPAGFSHLVGYDAGYYSYLWALVYACDAFGEFKKHGLRNKELGMRWKKEVLEKGSSEDEMKLIKNFLGRSPNQKAFLKEIGVK